MTENIEKRSFLDLGGLKILWNKITSTFASKAELTKEVYKINSDVLELENEITNVSENYITDGYVLDENDNLLYKADKANSALIFKVDNEFVVNSESLHALTHKAAAAMYGNLVSRISSIPKFKISIVDKLPNFETDEISLSTIYLVKNGDATSNNMYTEYICIDTVDKNTDKHALSWERLGEQSLVIDGYVTEEYVMQLLSETLQLFVSKNELEEFKTEVLTYIQSAYVTKEDVKDFVNEDKLAETLENYFVSFNETTVSSDSSEKDVVTNNNIFNVTVTSETESLTDNKGNKTNYHIQIEPGDGFRHIEHVANGAVQIITLFDNTIVDKANPDYTKSELVNDAQLGSIINTNVFDGEINIDPLDTAQNTSTTNFTKNTIKVDEETGKLTIEKYETQTVTFDNVPTVGAVKSYVERYVEAAPVSINDIYDFKQITTDEIETLCGSVTIPLDPIDYL